MLLSIHDQVLIPTVTATCMVVVTGVSTGCWVARCRCTLVYNSWSSWCSWYSHISTGCWHPEPCDVRLPSKGEGFKPLAWSFFLFLSQARRCTKSGHFVFKNCTGIQWLILKVRHTLPIHIRNYLIVNKLIITYCIGKGGFGYVCLCLCVCWLESVRILFSAAQCEWRH